MIVQSEAYRRAVKLNARESRISGTITLNDGTKVALTNDDILKGSLSITNKCVNNANFAYGAVYCGEINVSVITSISRYTMYGASIELYHELKVSETEFEKTRLGIFDISEANRTNGIIQIKGFDRMLRFEKEIDENMYDNMFTLLTAICKKCEMNLANTEEEISAMTNAGKNNFYTLRQDYIDTYRDAISCMSALMCCFCTINADGDLEVRQWGKEPVDRLSADDWKSGASISDFKTYFFGVKMRFIANENYYPYTAHEEFDNGGLLLDLGDNPIVIATNEEKNAIVENIFNELKLVEYVPFAIDVNKADPSFELGDMVEVVTEDGSIAKGYVMESSWKWRVGHTIKSLGKNPLLMSAKDKAAKSLISFEKIQQDGTMIVHTYTNAKKLDVAAGEQTLVALFNVSAIRDTTAIAVVSVPLIMECDAHVIIRVSRDNVVDESYIVRHYVQRGESLITWSYYIPFTENARATIKVTFELEYFESDYRREVASRKTNTTAIETMISAFDKYQNETITFDKDKQEIVDREKVDISYVPTPIDTNVVNGTIKETSIRGALFGSGLAGGENWDGTINVDDRAVIELDTMSISARDIVSVSTHKPKRNDIVESLNLVFDGLDIVVRDEVSINETRERTLVKFIDNKYVKNEKNTLTLKTEYIENSVREDIDVGMARRVRINLAQYSEVRSVEVL